MSDVYVIVWICIDCGRELTESVSGHEELRPPKCCDLEMGQMI